jgi:hypothetical protein
MLKEHSLNFSVWCLQKHIIFVCFPDCLHDFMILSSKHNHQQLGQKNGGWLD